MPGNSKASTAKKTALKVAIIGLIITALSFGGCFVEGAAGGAVGCDLTGEIGYSTGGVNCTAILILFVIIIVGIVMFGVGALYFIVAAIFYKR